MGGRRNPESDMAERTMLQKHSSSRKEPMNCYSMTRSQAVTDQCSDSNYPTNAPCHHAGVSQISKTVSSCCVVLCYGHHDLMTSLEWCLKIRRTRGIASGLPSWPAIWHGFLTRIQYFCCGTIEPNPILVATEASDHSNGAPFSQLPCTYHCWLTSQATSSNEDDEYIFGLP